MSEIAAAAHSSSHAENWVQVGPGSPWSIAASASRWMRRRRSRRSYSMSAIRSPMPSLSVICHRAERLRSSSACDFASSSPAIIRGVPSGSSSAPSSDRRDRRRFSVTESRSWLTERRCSRSALPAISFRRWPISTGKPDSALSSLSCRRAASSRRSEETANSGMSGATCASWARSIASTRRQSRYRSVLDRMPATLGVIRMAWRRNRISGSVYSCDASETSSMASAVGKAVRVVNVCEEPSPPHPGYR
ncbi:hypothetical protein AHiyo4_41450 [Arthrobacter sp. Hiyo4]|nr:hypothetical protein AHiyo4_41450 [Arthrobacter sp. Hiyo4]